MPIAEGGGYTGPFAHRQGKPMRPDVALAFDRMEKAARADGVALIITARTGPTPSRRCCSRAHPDPKWVAPPGTSLHRFGTELDLGPPAAYAWLAANAQRFHFIQRYEHEPWHYGYTLNPRSTPRPGDSGEHQSALPSFVPDRYAPMLARAAQRWNVSAALLAAQLYAESNFNPFATSPAGAQGIAQFMPGTAQALGLDDPFDAAQAIDAQAHLMRDLLRRFASVPLALAAYNAGPGAVAALHVHPAVPRDARVRRAHPRAARRRRRPAPTGDGAGGAARRVNRVTPLGAVGGRATARRSPGDARTQRHAAGPPGMPLRSGSVVYGCQGMVPPLRSRVPREEDRLAMAVLVGVRLQVRPPVELAANRHDLRARPRCTSAGIEASG